jgi:predicted secreted protein
MAFASLGTKLRIGVNNIAELTEVTGVELTADNVDVTSHDSNGWRSYIPTGLKDAGEISISGFFNPGDTLGQIALNTSFYEGSILDYTIIFPNSVATWSCKGMVSNIGTAATLEDPASFSATIKLTGTPTLATTASAGLTALSLTGTGGTLSPTFSTSNRVYSFSGVTASSVTVTATAASHTIQLYVDGSFVQTLTSAVASNAISLSTGIGREINIVAFEVNKTQILYSVGVIKTA